MIEDLRRNQIDSWIKTLPPLPPGWVYDFIPGEPKYNPETNAWETTMEAKPRQNAEQKPAEWSEEDEHRITDAIYFLESAKIHYADTSEIEETIAWLNSLRDNYKKCNSRWKPSEEQMSMLLAVINDPNNAGAESCQIALKSLYEQLKKLM